MSTVKGVTSVTTTGGAAQELLWRQVPPKNLIKLRSLRAVPPETEPGV